MTIDNIHVNGPASISTANVILVLVGDFTFNWSLGAVTDGAKNSKNTQI